MSPFPDDVDACALFAADVANVMRAEACARELARALASWRAPQDETVLWVPTSARGYGYQIYDTKPDVWLAATLAWLALPESAQRWDDVVAEQNRILAESEPPTAPREDLTQIAQELAPWAYGAAQWSEAASRFGKPWCDAANPFAIGLSLLETGYAMMPSGNGCLVLGYPDAGL